MYQEQEQEYRDLVEAFMDWCNKCCLHLNTTKTKEIMVNFRRTKPPVSIQEEDIKVTNSCKDSGVLLDEKLD